MSFCCYIGRAHGLRWWSRLPAGLEALSRRYPSPSPFTVSLTSISLGWDLPWLVIFIIMFHRLIRTLPNAGVTLYSRLSSKESFPIGSMWTNERRRSSLCLSFSVLLRHQISPSRRNDSRVLAVGIYRSFEELASAHDITTLLYRGD